MKRIASVFLCTAIVMASVAPLFQARQASAFGLTTIEVGPKAVASFFSTIASAVSNKITAAFTGVSAGANVSTAIATGIPGVSGAAMLPVKVATETACEPAEKLDEIESVVDSVSQGFSFIGPNPAETAFLNKRIAQLTYAKTCREAALQALNTKPILSVIDGLEMLRQQDYLNRKILSLDQRLESLKARSTASLKDVMKGVALKVVSNLNQRITTNLVNNIINKYKIDNYLQYADAVGTQVYTVDYIQQNYGSSQDQMILRSILQNDQTGGKVLPMVRARADESLGFVPQDLDISDPEYYTKLAQAGTGQTNPFFMQDVFEVNAAQAKANGQQQAQAEIAQSNGFMSIRNCSGSLAQSRSLDSQRLNLQQEVTQKKMVYDRMNAAAFDKRNTVEPAELETAKRQYEDANRRMTAFPKSNPGSVRLCEGVENPGGFIANSASGYLNSLFNASAKTDSANMPFWANFVSDVASNYASNIIRGNKSNNQLLLYSGFQAANLVANDAINAAGSAQSRSLQYAGGSQSVVYGISRVEGATGMFNIEWNAEDAVNASQTVKYVIITGPGNFSRRIDGIRGKLTIRLTADGTYVLHVYGDKLGSNSSVTASDVELAASSADVKVNVPSSVTNVNRNFPGYQAANPASVEDIINRRTDDEVNKIPPDPPLACDGLFASYSDCIAQGNNAGYCGSVCGAPQVQGAYTSTPRGPVYPRSND